GKGLNSGVNGNIPVANRLCISKYLYGMSHTVLLFTDIVILLTSAPDFVVIRTTPLPALEPYNAAALGPFKMDTLSMSSGFKLEIAFPYSTLLSLPICD